MNFVDVDILNIKNFNPFDEIGKKWALVTAGDDKKFNTMTISWGGMGVLWNKNVSFIFVRPQRYTFEFLENSSYYTISFFEKEYKKILNYCGRFSGRNVNKVASTGLKPIIDIAPYFEQAKMVLICKKIYAQNLSPSCFLEDNLNLNYKNNDYHKMYIGEIVKCIVKEKEN